MFAAICAGVSPAAAVYGAIEIIGVEPDGDVDIKTIDLPYQARMNKLEVDEKNIYRFGMGFNSSQMGDGNITNTAV